MKKKHIKNNSVNKIIEQQKLTRISITKILLTGGSNQLVKLACLPAMSRKVRYNYSNMQHFNKEQIKLQSVYPNFTHTSGYS